MDSQCMMNNCRNRAPDDQPFCAKHREAAKIRTNFCVNCKEQADRLEALEAEVAAYRQPAAKPDQVEAVARLEAALKLIAGSHWERWGMDQTDIEELPDLSAEEAMNAARDALSYDDDQPAAQAAIAAMRPVVTDEIAAERERQKTVEGWTPEHDDEHTSGELAHAAACYAYGETIDTQTGCRLWPWEDEWFKSSTRRRDLIKAGALIVAEIERLDRLEAALGAKL